MSEPATNVTCYVTGKLDFLGGPEFTIWGILPTWPETRAWTLEAARVLVRPQVTPPFHLHRECRRRPCGRHGMPTSSDRVCRRPTWPHRLFSPPTRTRPRIINPPGPGYSNPMRGMVMIARTITTYQRWHGEATSGSDTRHSRAQPLELGRWCRGVCWNGDSGLPSAGI